MENDRYKHSLTVLGLCVVNDSISDIVRSINETKRVYTLNDFYRPIAYPWLDSQCCDLTVFQIHEKLPEELPEGRFVNWKNEYNERGAKAIVMKKQDGLRSQDEFPMEEALTIFPKGWFQSSFGYMTAYAYIKQDIRDFRFFGFSMREAAHYRDSIPGCLYIFETLRKMGCSVFSPVENTWKSLMEKTGIDWANIPDVKVMYGKSH